MFLDFKTFLFQDKEAFWRRCSLKGGGNMSQAWREMFLNICFVINIMQHMLESYIKHTLGLSPKTLIKHPPAYKIIAESKSFENVKYMF